MVASTDNNEIADTQKIINDAVNHLDKSRFIISEDNFNTPEMGEFYIGEIDDTYLKNIDKRVQNSLNGDAKKAAFYIESPPITKLGYYPNEGVMFVKAKVHITEEDRELGKIDGNTISIPYENIDYAEDENISSIFKQGAKNLFYDLSKNSYNNNEKDNEENNNNILTPDEITIRMLGINSPKVPYWCKEVYFNIFNFRTEKKSLSSIINSDKYIYVKGIERNEDDDINFINMYKDIWNEYEITKDCGDGIVNIKWLAYDQTTKENYKQGIECAKSMLKMIQKANNEIYILIDSVTLSRNSATFPRKYSSNLYDNSILNKLKQLADEITDINIYRSTGFNLFGQDIYSRFLGTIYIKLNENTWINLSKYLISNYDQIEINKNFRDVPIYDERYSMASKLFGLDSYDFKSRVWADAFFEESTKLDDREEIQKEIFKTNFEHLKEWTVTIGDVTMFVPPTSIRCLTATTAERMPIIRAKGSMSKSAEKSERTIELSLFFNNDKGINGYEYKTKLPNNEEVTYHLNGLRALVSQFKFTPYLPITNNYINDVLNIEAVAFMRLQINTVIGFPKLIQVNLIMQEFSYRVYMPEIPVQETQDEEYRNYFSSCINYKTMRYYYQRPIIAGQKLAAKKLSFNSQEYIQATFGGTTVLQPMNFENSCIKFYVANEEYLKKMLQTKLEMLQKKSLMIVLSEAEKQAAQDIAIISKHIPNMIKDSGVVSALSNLNKLNNVGANMWNIENSLSANSIDDLYATSAVDLIQYETKVEQHKVLYTTIDDSQLKNNLQALLLNMKKYMNTVNEQANKKIIEYIKFGYEEISIEDNSDLKNGKILIGIVIKIALEYLTDDSYFSDLKRDASVYIEQPVDKFFNNREIFIPFAIKLKENAEINIYECENNPKFYFDEMSNDIMFLKYCERIADSKNDPNADAINRKQAIDIEQLNSIIFDIYDVGEVRINTFSINLINTMSKIGISDIDGYAPQYIGGQDSEINIELITTSQKTAAMLNALPRLSSFYAREYRLVIPCWPLKIESELTAFLGINETLIDSVTISTMEQTPNVYKINMRLISVDRTLRNREALIRIEAQNAGYQGITQRTTAAVKSYFDIRKTLGKAEIYPDLELPTIEELNKKNFNFIRYKFQDDRIYPDPDFYFVYSHLLTSQTIRESVIKSLEEKNEDGETEFTDTTNGRMKTTIKDNSYITTVASNDIAKKQEKQLKELKRIRNENIAAKEQNETRYNQKDLLKVLNESGTFESWSACPDIRCIFLEKNYKVELEAYKNFQTAKEVENAANIQNKQLEQKASEGEWIFNSMSKALEASNKIQEFLSTEITETVQPNASEQVNSTSRTPGNIKPTVFKYLNNEKIIEIMKLLNIENTDTFKNIVSDIIYSSACALTSEKEYSGKIIDYSWYPNMSFVGLKYAGNQDKGGMDSTNDVDDAIENAIEFGFFRIKQYEVNEFSNITGEKIDDPRTDLKKCVNSTRYLIDPFYRYADIEKIAEYKKGCINGTEYSTAAFFRIVLYWLKKLIDTNAFPTISTDILRNAVKNELDIQETQSKYLEDQHNQLYIHLDFFKKNSHSLDAGKYFAAIVLAMTSGDKKIRSRIDKRDYKGLNGYLQGCSMPSTRIDPSDKSGLYMRKMMLALVGVGRIKKDNLIGENQLTPSAEIMQNINEKLYLEAAEDTRKYILHSHYDMIVNDCRGRMLRAFPTFYMFFIDEGREIGMWRLHDNFLNTSAISEFQIVKSRKIAADTARIVLSNMYKTFTTEDEDAKFVYNTDFDEVFDSIFSPTSYAKKQEIKRSKIPPASRFRIRAGARIHLRMGYGSNAANLPIVFNGTVAEVQTGEMLELIAQGDGIELTNPILENDEAHEIQFKDSILENDKFTNGATPKTILNSLLTTAGGVLRDVLKDTRFANLLGRNPYGIYHFGDPDFRTIFKSGEPTQNIYEAIAKPAWGDDNSITAQWATDDVPTITFDIFGKSIWDIANICKSVTPDFITSVAPFGFRSTLFHGAPRYYYAYDYVEREGIMLEKRKPFQQYHIYNSFTDIIKNGITASEKDIKTCAIGLYQMSESLNIKSQERCGPLWADIEIYPENQKTIVVDTQLLGKGIPIVGFALNTITNRLTNLLADDKGKLTSHDRIAWRMTASVLKDSMKDMYQGELLILGDPTVKPHDRLFINDTYENIVGQCLVKEVVHNFSVNNGFTTSVTPDCIAVVDDPHEISVQTLWSKVVSYSAVVNTGMVWGASKMFGGPAVRLVNMLEKLTANGTELIKTGAQFVSRKAISGGAIAQTSEVLAKVKDAFLTIKNFSSASTITNGLLATTGLTTAAASVIVNAALIGTIYISGRYVTEMIGRWAKNLQVLQIFPLKKNGLVLTAGINGNKGSVYGSPTYNNPGFIKGLYGDITGASDNPFVEILKDILMSEEMRAIGNKYKQANNIIDEQGEPVANEDQFLKTLKAVAGGQSDIQSGWKFAQITPRASMSNPKEVKDAYDHFAVLDIERLNANTKLKQNRLISNDERIKNLIENNFFFILHEATTSTDLEIKNMVLNINNKDMNVPVIVSKTTKGTIVYDLPMLNKDAIDVLYEILIRTKNKMPMNNSSDQYQAHEKTKKSGVTLKSALRAGDTDSIAAAGFTFILQGHDKAVAPLSAAIEELKKEIYDSASENELLEQELLDCKNLDGNEIAIIVRMPNI